MALDGKLTATEREYPECLATHVNAFGFSAVLLLLFFSLAWIAAPAPYTIADNEFAREYSASMIAELDATVEQVLSAGSTVQKLDVFLAGQDKFERLKCAAVYLKGRPQAEDFVYALQMAEDWCRYAGRSLTVSDNGLPAGIADRRLAKAYSLLREIATTDYTRLAP